MSTKTKLSPQAEAVLWACEGDWMDAGHITRALRTGYAISLHPNLNGWPRSDQGIHQTAASLVRKNLLYKDLRGGTIHYRKAGS